MNVPTIWGHLTRVVLLLIMAAGIVLVGVWYLPLIRENQAMREQLQRLEQELRNGEERMRQMKAAIEALRNDPNTVERLAREQLGLAKPGETVVHFEAVPTNPPPGAR